MHATYPRRDFIRNSSLLAAGLWTHPSWFPARNPSKDAPEIYVFSKHLQFLDYEELADQVKELGFDGADLTVRPGGHVLPENVRTDLPKVIRSLRKRGLSTAMMTTRITDPEDPQTAAILEVAAKEGIQFYRMGSWTYDYGRTIEDNISGFREKMRRLGELNEKFGIKGAYQNHSGTQFGAGVWDLHLMMEGMDPQWTGIQYDIKHATAEGGKSWPNALRLIHPYIHTLDIKDFLWEQKAGKWQETYTPLGEGMVNFPAFFELLFDLGFEGPLSIHYEYPLGGAEHGKRALTLERKEVFQAMTQDLNTLIQLLLPYRK